MKIDRGLIERCYEESLRLLRENTTPAGILASAPTRKAVERGYASVFGRDAAIAALGMLVSGDDHLVASARAGLLTLADYQAPNGQIPKFVEPASGTVDFWYTGCIDATLWWLVALKSLDGGYAAQSERLVAMQTSKVKSAVDWLQCHEHQSWRLLQQNEASDWADIMPRSGYVLYTNALWYLVKKLYDLPAAEVTSLYANHFFHPYDGGLPEERRARLIMHYIRNRSKQTPFYLSFVNFSTWGEEVDVFGNILACLAGLADTSRAGKIVDSVMSLGLNRPHPVRVVGTPISREAPLWRVYMQRHRQNLAWQYHNGGIWPFVGGFWILLLARLRRYDEAWRELEALASANRVEEWRFSEWFHGQTGEPAGMSRQSWNAALFILACRTLQEKRDLFP